MRRKVFYQLDKARGRFVSNYRLNSGYLAGHLSYLYSQLHPRDSLQERVINFNQFLFEEGMGFVPRLMEVIRPFDLEHQVIYV